MTILSGSNMRIDMTSWGYPSMTPVLLSQAGSGPDYIYLTSDIYALAGLPQNWYANQIKLIGSGFGDFGPGGMPHSGTVTSAYLQSTLTPEYERVIGLEGLNLPVDQFFTLLSAFDASVLRNALFAGDDRISGTPGDTRVMGDIAGESTGDHLLGGRETTPSGVWADTTFWKAAPATI